MIWMKAGAKIPNVVILESLGTRNLIVQREREGQPSHDSVSKSAMSHEEIDLVLCTIIDVIIEQKNEESISLADEVAEGIKDKHPVK